MTSDCHDSPSSSSYHFSFLTSQPFRNQSGLADVKAGFSYPLISEFIIIGPYYYYFWGKDEYYTASEENQNESSADEEKQKYNEVFMCFVFGTKYYTMVEGLKKPSLFL